MLQFYFLSVATLLLGGTSLLMGSTDDAGRTLPQVFGSRTIRYSLAGASLLVGLVKLFVRAPGDTVVVAGDLLPALTGIALGLALFAVAWSVRPGGNSQQVQKITRLTRFYRYPIGVAGVVVGLAHFFVPATVIV